MRGAGGTVSEAELERMISERRILALPLAWGWGYPAIQFDRRQAVVHPVIVRLLQNYGDVPVHSILYFLYGAHAALVSRGMYTEEEFLANPSLALPLSLIGRGDDDIEELFDRHLHPCEEDWSGPAIEALP